MYRVYKPKVNPNYAVQAYFAGNKNKKTGLIIGKCWILFMKRLALLVLHHHKKSKPDITAEIRLAGQ